MRSKINSIQPRSLGYTLVYNKEAIMLVCSECGSYGVYVNLSVNVNDYYEGELRDAELGETICKACGNEGVLGCFGTKEKDN